VPARSRYGPEGLPRSRVERLATFAAILGWANRHCGSTESVPQFLDFRRRCDAEFAAKQFAAYVVLFRREAQSPSVPVQPDDGGVNVFLQRVEGQGPLCDRHGAIRIAGSGPHFDK